MKRFLAIACGLFALAAVQPANATDGWAGADLNFRSGAGTDYQVITVIPYCAKFDYWGCSYGWCHASYNGYDGYLSEKYIRHSPCQSYSQPSYTPPPQHYNPPPKYSPPPQKY